MPLSYAHYQGDGDNRLFAVPCEYLAKAHVKVRVDGTLVPFSWIDTYRLQTSTAPPAQSVVEVRRTTPREDRLVTFTDGSTLVQSDLNTSTLQSFFLAQEAFDQGAASMAVTEDGQFSALQRRITSLADPVNAQDAVTKRWVLSAENTNLTAAVAAKDASVVARQGSETARSGSEVARAGAEAARDEARAHRDTASAHRLNAQNAQAASELACDGSVAAKAGLEAARDVAVTKAGEASGSAAAAAKSAQDAALFDPSSYWTKTQSDSRYLSSTALAPYSTTAQMNTALTAKLDKAGGTSTGNLTIQNTAPTLVLTDTDQGTRSLHNNSSQIGFLGNHGDWIFRTDDNGSIWTRQFGDLNQRIEDRAWAHAQSGKNEAIGNVMPTIAAQGANQIGTYALMIGPNRVRDDPGAQRSGGELRFAGGDGYPAANIYGAGAWRCMGHTNGGGGTNGQVTLWMRYA